MRSTRSIPVLLAALLSGKAGLAQAVPDNVGQASTGMPAILEKVTFRPELDKQMPLEAAFTDESGRNVKLGSYFGQGKPVLLAFVYYRCPMMCTQLEQGVVGSLRMLSFNPGRDYEVVFVSFDERDTAAMAGAKKSTAIEHFRRPETAPGWHFLSGSRESIEAVTRAANFRFNFDAKNNLFAHASGILLLTPDGRISRYFYGVEFPGRDLRLGLVDASRGKIGTPVDRVMLYCFQYDPASARYSATVLGIMRVGAVVTVLGLVLMILVYRRREARAPRTKLSQQGAH
jgi:protein SCO1/2